MSEYEDSTERTGWGNIPFDYPAVNRYLIRLANLHQLEWMERSKGIYMIRYDEKEYTYWPKKGKWKVVRDDSSWNKKIYWSKSKEDFFNNYVFGK